MAERNKIIIADDIEMNRAILAGLLGNKYKILEADDGNAALALAEENSKELAAIILDMIMPQKDGLEALKELKDLGITDTVPTVMTSVELTDEFMLCGHEYGACDVIEKPFNPHSAARRIENLIELYDKKNRLEQLLKKQTGYLMQQDEKIRLQQDTINNMNNTMLDTLSTVIEYRDVESGKHVRRIREFTEVLLRVVAERYPEYNLTEDKINLIASASSVHDIGKIAIPDSILLAPRRLTYDEFNIMKQHTTKGCEILDLLDLQEKSEYFQYCYEICRHHHEKWDGMGYPDGLSGDDIPISAQVVSVADCYDALTSSRPYKAAIPHERAVEMINSGACGAFSDKLLECFNSVLPQFEKLAKEYADKASDEKQASEAEEAARRSSGDTAMSIYSNMSRRELIGILERQKQVAKETHERDCQIFYRINDMVFECDLKHDNFHMRKGEWEKFYNYFPKNYTEAVTMLSSSCHPDDVVAFNKIFRLSNVKKNAEKGKEKLEFDGRFMQEKGVYSWYRCSVIPFCEEGKLRRLFCCAAKISGKSIESGDKRYREQHDNLTGLWNVSYLRRAVDDYLMHSGKDGMHALISIDIDDFKALNLATDISFGDEVLCSVAQRLNEHFGASSIVARIGSDSFVVFLEDCYDINELSRRVEELYRSMHMSFEYLLSKHSISVSIGVSQYPKDGTGFTELMDNADFATEMSKLQGKDMYLFYNKEMRKSFEEKPALALASNDENVNIYDFKRVFIPVISSDTDIIVSYEYLELPDMDIKYTLDELCEMAAASDNITALGLNSIKRLLKGIYKLQKDCGHMPEISVYTMLKGTDAPAVLKTIAGVLSECSLDCTHITINITQGMLNNMSYRELVAFSDAVHAFGFKLGLFNFGLEYINVKCFTEKLFDSVCLSSGFVNGIADGSYPGKLLKLVFEYFSSNGVLISLPYGLNSTTIEIVRRLCGGSFVYQGSEMLSTDVFRIEMELAGTIPKTPILCHEKYELSLTKSMYSEIFTDMKFVLFRWQLNNDSVWFSDSFREIYGIEPPTENLVEYIKNFEFIHPDDRQKYAEKLLAVKAGYHDAECFVRIIKKSISNEYRWSRLKFTCILDDNGVPESVIGFENDIDDERRERENAKHDFLTQLLSKDALKYEIGEFLQTSEGEKGTHALMFIDIDNFKNVHEHLGQIFADAFLKDVTEKLRKTFREYDLIGRVGRDQFVVFLKSIKDDNIPARKAETICSILKRDFESEDNTVSVSGSVGISLYPNDGADFDELFGNSKAALFSVKHKGKNGWLFYSPELSAK